MFLFRGKLAVPVGGRDAAVHQEIAPRDECAIRAHQKGTDGSYFIRGAGTPGRAQLDHASVPIAARARQLVVGERRDDDAGADRIDSRAPLAPSDGFGLDAQRVAALGELVGVQGVLNLRRLQQGQRKQLLRRRGGKRLVLLGRQCAQAMT